MIPFWPIVAPRLLKQLSVVILIGAMTAWPFIFSREPMNETDLRHEGTHACQQFECSVLQVLALLIGAWAWTPWLLLGIPVAFAVGGPLFLVLYYGSYAVNLLRLDGVAAYEAIPFEQEAYAHEDDFTYLKHRIPVWSWLCYFIPWRR